MGPFDNETGNHVFDESLINKAHWYIDEEGSLFIVSDGAEIEGPEGESMDVLNSHYAGSCIGDVDVEFVEDYGDMTFIHPWQRRFDPKVGYFVV